jgi:hypothetical protein
MKTAANIIITGSLLPLFITSNSTYADLASSSENFSTRQANNYSTWLVGCFDGNADIRTMDSRDSLVVYSGYYDLNLNGSPQVQSALANNNSAEQTYILFNQGLLWDHFSGDFSCVWNATTSGRISFTFLNTTTSTSQTVSSTLEGLNGSLRSLDFRIAGGFNQIIIDGNFVIMDNLVVSIPAPAAAPLLALAGLTARSRRRK